MAPKRHFRRTIQSHTGGCQTHSRGNRVSTRGQAHSATGRGGSDKHDTSPRGSHLIGASGISPPKGFPATATLEPVTFTRHFPLTALHIHLEPLRGTVTLPAPLPSRDNPAASNPNTFLVSKHQHSPRRLAVLLDFLASALPPRRRHVPHGAPTLSSRTTSTRPPDLPRATPLTRDPRGQSFNISARTPPLPCSCRRRNSSRAAERGERRGYYGSPGRGPLAARSALVVHDRGDALMKQSQREGGWLRGRGRRIVGDTARATGERSRSLASSTGADRSPTAGCRLIAPPGGFARGRPPRRSIPPAGEGNGVCPSAKRQPSRPPSPEANITSCHIDRNAVRGPDDWSFRKHNESVATTSHPWDGG